MDSGQNTDVVAWMQKLVWMQKQEDSAPEIGGAALMRRVAGGVLTSEDVCHNINITGILIASRPVGRTLIVCSRTTEHLWMHDLISHGLTVYQMFPDRAREVLRLSHSILGYRCQSVAHEDVCDDAVCVATYDRVVPLSSRNEELKIYAEATTPPEMSPFANVAWDRVVFSATDDPACRLSCEPYGPDKGLSDTSAILMYARMMRLGRAKRADGILAPRWVLTGAPYSSYVTDVAALFRWIGVHTAVSLQSCVFRKLFRLAVPHCSKPPDGFRYSIEYASAEEATFYETAAAHLYEHFVECKSDTAEAFRLRMLVRLLNAAPARFVETLAATGLECPAMSSKHSMLMGKIGELQEGHEHFVALVYCQEEANMILECLDACPGYTPTVLGLGSSVQKCNQAIRTTELGVTNGDLQALILHASVWNEGMDLHHFYNILIPSPDLNSDMEDSIVAAAASAQQIHVWKYVHEAVATALEDFVPRRRIPVPSEQMIVFVTAPAASSPVNEDADTSPPTPGGSPRGVADTPKTPKMSIDPKEIEKRRICAQAAMKRIKSMSATGT